jgi:hypothetical protein
MLKKRVEVLFEPSEYHRLEEMAQAERHSVGSLVREAVEKYVVQPTQEERRRAFEWILRGEDDLGSWEELKEAISRGPAEGIERIERQIEADRR